MTSDGGMLYYRKDLVPTPPKTWDEMMGMCSIAKENKMDCYAGQFFKYEGLTVNAAEAINTDGGVIVGADGKTPEVTTPEAAKGLGGWPTPTRTATSPSRRSPTPRRRAAIVPGGQAAVPSPVAVRVQPGLVRGRLQGEGQVRRGATAGTPGKPGASSLGGHNAAISAYSDHKATALDFLKFLETEETQKWFVTQGSNAPALAALYDDPALIKEQPYLPTLKTSILNAVPRPVTPSTRP